MSFGGSHWCRSTPDLEDRSTLASPNRLTGSPEHRLMTPTESTASCNVVRILTHEEFAAKHPHPPSPDNVRIARRADTSIDRHGKYNIARQTKAAIDRQPPAPIDRRAPITYRVQMPKIDVARLNALRPKPKHSENPPETVRTPSDDGEDPMEEDGVPTGRTLRRRKEKVVKHLKRGANEKEKKNFRKRVFRISIDKSFEDAYYTDRLWMFFRETREKEEDIKRMLCKARENMRMRITLKKKSDHGQFVIPCTVKGIEFLHSLCDTGASVSIPPRIMADHLGLQDDFWQVVKEEKLQEGDFEVESLMSFGGSHWCRSTPDLEHRSTSASPNRSTGSPEHRPMTPTESTASCNAVRILTHEEFAAKHPHPPSPDNAQTKTFRKPTRDSQTPSDDGEDPMEEDRVPTVRTLRRRKEKVVKHLKRGANEKEKENFRKRVFRISIDKPFEDAYYTDRLWMFFRETREKEEDIKRMLCKARENMRMRITLKKKSDHGQFVIPCTVKGVEFLHALCDTGASVSILPRVMADHLGLQVEPSQELFTFVDCSQRNSGRIVRDLEVHIDNSLVPDMSDTHYHGEEISADTYATLRRHQFDLESLEERLQRM
ncbi:hypothetical protein F2Q68_00034905 [Brassica cretica]|uniref:Aspartic peptidase DDI1-type domain-containing protein n=1 Tax=Brassica cretica TaxID=69181 RepID=A0A8S9H7W0_BRACR|nr:hypothetical protein F2Q68_00034905 [Brassica cretica]